MSESEKQRTIDAAWVAMGIIKQKQDALNKYRYEVLDYIEQNPGNYSFTFNMDFMKVTHKLILGYLGNRFSQRNTRDWQVSAESLKIAKETGASYQEVKAVFIKMMYQYINSF